MAGKKATLEIWTVNPTTDWLPKEKLKSKFFIDHPEWTLYSRKKYDSEGGAIRAGKTLARKMGLEIVEVKIEPERE